MKILKNIATTCLVALSISAFAKDEPASKKLSIDYALKTYISAFSEGKIKELPGVLDNDVKFTVTRGDQIVNYTRSEILSSIKPSENIQQNCITDYAIVDQNPNQAIVKVTMKYETFKKINFVTMSNTAKGWKITNVSSSYN